MAGASQLSSKDDHDWEECYDEEIRNVKETIKNVNLLDNQLKMPPGYPEMQCPFTWGVIDTLDGKKIHGQPIDGESTEFSTFCNTLLLGCISGVKKGKTEIEALENFSQCEQLLDVRSSEPFFKDIVPGMKHITNASRCHFYLKTEEPLLAAQISSSVQPFEGLSKKSKACVWAVKAYAFRKIGGSGKMEAYECIKRAIELDPDEEGSRKGLWHFYAGEIRAEIRSMQSKNEMPSKEELKHLERSVLHNPFPLHYAVLADAYRISAKIFKRNGNHSTADKLWHQSLEMYKKALEGNCTSLPVLSRCATGLTKLPTKYCDGKLARDCIKQCLSVDPDNELFHYYLGNVEEWYRKDYGAAMKCFEKSFECGNHLAGLRAIKLKYQQDKSYDILDACDKCVSDIQKTESKKKILNQMLHEYFAFKAEYYLEVKKDLVAAAREWEKAFDISPNSKGVREYHCFFTSITPTPRWNLYEIVERKIKYGLATSKLSESDRDYLKGLLSKCKKGKK